MSAGDAIVALYLQVLRPLCWCGLLNEHGHRGGRISDRTFAKTPLWKVALRLDTDGMVTQAGDAALAEHLTVHINDETFWKSSRLISLSTNAHF